MHSKLQIAVAEEDGKYSLAAAFLSFDSIHLVYIEIRVVKEIITQEEFDSKKKALLDDTTDTIRMKDRM